jgi:hypothetical protein
MKWTDEEIDILKEYYPKGGVKEAQKHLNTERSEHAIRRKAEDLHIIEKTYGRRWAKEEVEVLKKYYPKGGTWAVQKHLVNRSKDGIEHKAAELKLSDERQWTRKELRLLREYYPEGGAEAVKKRIQFRGRSIEAINRKAESMNIKVKKDDVKPLPNEGMSLESQPAEKELLPFEEDVISPFDEDEEVFDPLDEKDGTEPTSKFDEIFKKNSKEIPENLCKKTGRTLNFRKKGLVDIADETEQSTESSFEETLDKIRKESDNRLKETSDSTHQLTGNDIYQLSQLLSLLEDNPYQCCGMINSGLISKNKISRLYFKCHNIYFDKVICGKYDKQDVICDGKESDTPQNKSSNIHF